MSYTAAEIWVAFKNYAKSRGFIYKNTGGHSYRKYKNTAYPYIIFWKTVKTIDGVEMKISISNGKDKESEHIQESVGKWLIKHQDDWLEKKWLQNDY